jgi:glycine cleavage system H protein
MSTLLAMLSAAIVVGLRAIGWRRETKPSSAVFVERYLHPGHTWMRLTDDGEVVVGVDSFAPSVLGKVDALILPRLLQKVEQGGTVLRLQHGRRSLSLRSPVKGRVIEKNEMVIRHPELINESPYGTGWLFKVHPHDLTPQLRNLFSNKWAQAFQETSRSHLQQMLWGTPLLTYQDGGQLRNNLSEYCSDSQWRLVQERFFLDGESSQSQ